MGTYGERKEPKFRTATVLRASGLCHILPETKLKAAYPVTGLCLNQKTRSGLEILQKILSHKSHTKTKHKPTKSDFLVRTGSETLASAILRE